MVNSSVLERLYSFTTAVFGSWWSWLCGTILVLESVVELFFPKQWKRLEEHFPQSKRRIVLLWLCLFAFVAASFSAYDAVSTQLLRTQLQLAQQEAVSPQTRQRHVPKQTQDCLAMQLTKASTLRITSPFYVTSSMDNDSAALRDEIVKILHKAGVHPTLVGFASQLADEVGYIAYIANPMKPSPQAQQLLDVMKECKVTVTIKDWDEREGFPPFPDLLFFVTRDEAPLQ